MKKNPKEKTIDNFTEVQLRISVRTQSEREAFKKFYKSYPQKIKEVFLIKK